MRKIVSLIIIGVLLVLNFNLVQDSLSSSQKLSEVSKVEDRIKNLEAENQELKSELTFRDSSFFVEKEARDKLGFGKPGETTIVVANQLINQTKQDAEEKNKSNLAKWFDLIRN